MLDFVIAATLAQPLDASKVKSTRVEAAIDFEPTVTPPDGADMTFDGGAADRAVLERRFGVLAGREGLPGFGGVAPEPGLTGGAAGNHGP